MTRIALAGDGQLDVFRSKDELLAYIDPPEARSGEFFAFSDNGDVFKFCLNKNDDIFLQNHNVLNLTDVQIYVNNFIERTGDKKFKFRDIFSALDYIVENFGYQH